MYSAAAAFNPLCPPADEEVMLIASSFTIQSTLSLPKSPYMSCVGLVSRGNSYAFRLGLCGMAGLENAKRGDGRGDVKGDAVDDMARLNDWGMNPGGARGLTPSRGEEEIGVPLPLGICHGAGEGRRRTVWRMGGGDVAALGPSR